MFVPLEQMGDSRRTKSFAVPAFCFGCCGYLKRCVNLREGRHAVSNRQNRLVLSMRDP